MARSSSDCPNASGFGGDGWGLAVGGGGFTCLTHGRCSASSGSRLSSLSLKRTVKQSPSASEPAIMSRTERSP